MSIHALRCRGECGCPNVHRARDRRKCLAWGRIWAARSRNFFRARLVQLGESSMRRKHYRHGERPFSIDRGLHSCVTFNQDPGGDYGRLGERAAVPAKSYAVQNAWNCYGQSAEISARSPRSITSTLVGYDLVTDNGGKWRPGKYFYDATTGRQR